LSTSLGDKEVDNLDRWTSPVTHDPLSLSPVGSLVTWIEPSFGEVRQGVIDDIEEWPGLPEEVAYWVSGQIVPPSRVREVLVNG